MARTIQQSQADKLKVDLVGRDEGEPEYYVDGVHGLQLTGPVIKLNLYTLGIDTGPEYQRRESVCRLVMSTPQFVGMVDFLTQYVAQLRKQAEQMRSAAGNAPSGAGVAQPAANS